MRELEKSMERRKRKEGKKSDDQSYRGNREKKREAIVKLLKGIEAKVNVEQINKIGALERGKKMLVVKLRRGEREIVEKDCDKTEE